MTVDLDRLRADVAISENIVIAAPYLKVAALKWLIEPLPAEATLICVTRWTPADIINGASDLACEDIIVSRNGEFRLHDRLHAKFFRFNERIYIGSANITMRGLGLVPGSNLEILCSPDDEFNATEFEATMMAESRLVDEEEMRDWKALAEEITVIQRPEEQDWLPATRDPHHVILTYLGRKSRIASLDERRLAERDLSALAPPSGLTERRLRAWIAGRLWASARVREVRETRDLAEIAAWDQLVASWGVSRREALRTRSTVENWMREFLDGS